MMVLYSAVYITICVVKYVYFLYSDFDMAIDAQAAFMIPRGSSYSSILNMNYFGNHIRLLILPIVPIYAVLPSPVTLLVIQTVVLALGALPVHWLARRELKNDFLAVCFAGLYLLYPAVGYTNLYEFHPETLATTTLLFTFYYLWVGRFGLMVLFAVLSLLGKENVPLVVGMMGLYSLLLRRRRRWVYAAALVTLAVLFLVASFGVALPRLNRGEVQFTRLYRHWGDSTGEALLAMAKDPARVLKGLFFTLEEKGTPAELNRLSRMKGEYYVHMLLPLMLLPLASPLTLILAFPLVAQHLLSARDTEYTIVYHYTALVTPVFIAAAVLGLRNILRLLVRGVPGGLSAEVMNTKTPARALGCVMGGLALVVSLGSNVLFGPLFGLGLVQAKRADEKIWPSARDRALAPYMREMMRRVPREGAVACGLRFLVRFSNRRDLHALHHIAKGMHTLSDKPYPVPEDVVAVVVDTQNSFYMLTWNYNRGAKIREFLVRNRLRLVDAADSVVLLLRESSGQRELLEEGEFRPDTPLRAGFGGRVELLGWDRIPPKAEVGGKLPLRTVWKRVGPEDPRACPLYLMQLVLLDRHNRLVYGTMRYLGHTLYSVHDWPRDRSVRETCNLVIPDSVRPGTYAVGMRVLEQEGKVFRVAPTTDPRLRETGGVIGLGRVEVVPAGGG